jgi:hypothetical protein
MATCAVDMRCWKFKSHLHRLDSRPTSFGNAKLCRPHQEFYSDACKCLCQAAAPSVAGPEEIQGMRPMLDSLKYNDAGLVAVTVQARSQCMANCFQCHYPA